MEKRLTGSWSDGIQVNQTSQKSLFVNYTFGQNEFMEIKTEAAVITRRKGKNPTGQII